jgi:hypothetical protein
MYGYEDAYTATTEEAGREARERFGKTGNGNGKYPMIYQIGNEPPRSRARTRGSTGY